MDEDQTDVIETHFNPIRLIQEGSFGRVFECTDLNQPDGKHFAVKVIKKSSRRHKVETLKNQAKILETIRHPNIIGFLGLVQGGQFIYLKMQLAKGGSLGELIREHVRSKCPIPDDAISCIMKAIFNGLSHLHTLNIIHRDLKPDNILIADKNDLSTVKIADFGMSVKMEYRTGRLSSHCGTLLYMAPEIIFKKAYSRNVDVWSCAVIMYMLFNGGNHPVVPKNQRKSMTLEMYSILVTKAWPHLSEEKADHFMRKLSAEEPLQRYTASDALRHPFLGGDIAPLTYHQSFRAFQTTQHTQQLIRLGFIILKASSIPIKLTIPHDYLAKVEEYNETTFQRRLKQASSKKSECKRTTSDEYTRNLFKEQSNYDSSSVDQVSSPLLRKTKFAQFTNLRLEDKYPLSQSIPFKQTSSVGKSLNLFNISKSKKPPLLTVSRNLLFQNASISPKKLQRVPGKAGPIFDLRQVARSTGKFQYKQRCSSSGHKRKPVLGARNLGQTQTMFLKR